MANNKPKPDDRSDNAEKLQEMIVNTIENMEEAEVAPFMDTLTGLIQQNYVLTNKVNVRTIEDVSRAFFRVNPAFAVALRDALSPARRMARERERDRTRRRRRR